MFKTDIYEWSFILCWKYVIFADIFESKAQQIGKEQNYERSYKNPVAEIARNHFI